MAYELDYDLYIRQTQYTVDRAIYVVFYGLKP